MLWRKMVRDIWENKGSYIACLVIVLMGLIVFTSVSIVSTNLELAKETFYREQNFAHGFAEIVVMPEANVARLAQIEGIREINGRIVKEVQVHDPEREENVYLKLVSLDLSDPNRVNDARLLEGTELVEGELLAWVDNQFFAAHNLKLGDTLEIIAGGRSWEITIAGVGMSPEFSYPIRGAELYPNPEQFGIAFLPRADMKTLFPELGGQVNDVVFTLEDGVGYEQVRDRLELELDQYGLLNLYPREDQISHIILTQEIEGQKAAATSFPLLFLTIAGIILYIMLKRLVEQQRGQIGILLGLGYTRREIARHYLSYALVVGAGGGLLGGLIGIGLATPLTELMMAFFNVPIVYEGFSWFYLGQGLLLSVAVFLVAGYTGARYALQLKPAEAMRPPAPPSGRKFILEKIGFFSAMLTMQGKMAIRNLSRNKGRSLFMFLGIMLSCALVAVSWSFSDMVDKLIFYQYDQVEVYDAKVTLAGPRAGRPAQRELEGNVEVSWVEPLAEIPVTLSHRWREERVAVLGIFREGSLYNIRDSQGKKINPPAEGLLLSERLAEKLDVVKGSVLELKSPYLEGTDGVQVEVYDVIPQYIGMNAYMELSALGDLLGQGELATSLLVKFKEEGGIPVLRQRYRESELVAGIDSSEEQIGAARDLMETFGSIIYLYVLVGVVIGFAIIYSASFIVLSERSWELASMRVLGLTAREVFSVITFEQWFISFFAILAGLPLGQALQWAMGVGLSTDMYSLPSRLTTESFFMAVVITALSIWVAQRAALKRVEKLSLVEVLKSRE
ncbi:MAG: ABC transporter permease [bacterium]|jgi:putative ABC transport system permease protein